MPMFRAHEFVAESCEETGTVLFFDGTSREDAVSKCLYTLRLKNAHACVGPSGGVVYDGFGKGYSVVPDKKPLFAPSPKSTGANDEAVAVLG